MEKPRIQPFTLPRKRRFNLRLNRTEDELVRAAAVVEDTTPTDFLRRSATRQAAAVLHDYLRREGGLRG